MVEYRWEEGTLIMTMESPLTDVQLKALLGSLNPNRIENRKQGNTTLSYLAAFDIKATLIRIFGFGGFSAEADECEILMIENNVPKTGWASGKKVTYPVEYTNDGQVVFGTANFRVTARVRVKLTIHQLGAVYTEWAASSQTGPDIGEVSDFAIKGLAVDTPIPTPDGWATMGELSVGDVVFDMNGQPTVVEMKSEVKDLPCYRLTFNDGQQIICDEEHHWFARNGLNKPIRVHDVTELHKTKEAGGSVAMPIGGPLSGESLDLPVDPWTLGYWLGNGDTRAGRLTCHEDDLLHVSETVAGRVGPTQRKSGSRGVTVQVLETPELVAELGTRSSEIINLKASGLSRSETADALGISESTVDRTLQGKSLDGRTGLTSLLRQTGILGKKHIPARYLRASYEQRLALLRGLMDSDGSAGRKAVFSSTNRALAEQVAELVRSLGDRVAFTEYDANGFGLTVRAFSIQWTPSVIPFTMPRKVEKTRLRMKSGAHRVRSIERIESVPTQCIGVSSESKSYLAGEGMVPTHNTAESDALKRAAIYLGTQYGLSLYDSGSTRDVVKVVMAPGQEWPKPNPAAQEVETLNNIAAGGVGPATDEDKENAAKLAHSLGMKRGSDIETPDDRQERLSEEAIAESTNQ